MRATTEEKKAKTNVCVALVPALLPEQTETSNNWPEPVWPGGVQQPEEAGSQSSGCFHGPRQGWQSRPAG